MKTCERCDHEYNETKEGDIVYCGQCVDELGEELIHESTWQLQKENSGVLK